MFMPKLVRVDDKVFEQLHEVAARLQIEHKKRVTLGDAVAFLVQNSKHLKSEAVASSHASAPQKELRAYSFKHKKFME